MAVTLSLHSSCFYRKSPLSVNCHTQTPNFHFSKSITNKNFKINVYNNSIKRNHQGRLVFTLVNELEKDPIHSTTQDDEVDTVGVRVALSMLMFYKREISPLLPKSCRYVPTCSEYSMQAYKKYGVAKGTVLTAWRVCRCNPLGGTGYDPPRWFDEPPLPEE